MLHLGCLDNISAALGFVLAAEIDRRGTNSSCCDRKFPQGLEWLRQKCCGGKLPQLFSVAVGEIHRSGKSGAVENCRNRLEWLRQKNTAASEWLR